MGKPILSGELAETSGTIGGFRLGTDSITDLLDSFGLASLVTDADDVRFWAGATFENRATAAFRVTEAGVLVATSATITGTITSTSGTIGGFTLGASSLSAGSGSTKVTLNTTGSDGSGVVMGDGSSNTIQSIHAASGFYVSENAATLAEVKTLGSAGSRYGWIRVYNSAGTLSTSLDGTTGKITGQTMSLGTWTGTPALATGDAYFSGVFRVVGAIRSDAGFNINGTAGASGTITLATTTTITVSGGLITGWA